MIVLYCDLLGLLVSVLALIALSADVGPSRGWTAGALNVGLVLVFAARLYVSREYRRAHRIGASLDKRVMALSPGWLRLTIGAVIAGGVVIFIMALRHIYSVPSARMTAEEYDAACRKLFFFIFSLQVVCYATEAALSYVEIRFGPRHIGDGL